MDEPLISPIPEEGVASRVPGREAAGIVVEITPVSDEVVVPVIGTVKPESIMNLLAHIGTKTRFAPTRSHSAPSVYSEARDSSRASSDASPSSRASSLIFRRVLICAIVYFVFMIPIFLLRDSFRDTYRTSTPVDVIYFSVVTFCTIGYGDVVPNTKFTKLYTCLFILAGCGFIYSLLNGLVVMICDRQEAILLSAMDENRLNNLMQMYMIDKEKGRMRIRTKVTFALAVVIVCLTVGTFGAHFLESYSWVDSLYLAVQSVTTIGYGDYTFKTLLGRCFAIIWLLISTVAVTRAFLYLAEFGIDKRNRRIAKRILQRKITLGDLVAADLDKDGSISKSEFVIFKLKEMGKITEKEILQICNQFDSLDSNSCGRITVADVMNN